MKCDTITRVTFTCKNWRKLNITKRRALREAAKAWLTRPVLKCDLDSTKSLINMKFLQIGKSL